MEWQYLSKKLWVSSISHPVFLTEERLANQVKAEDEQEVVDEITELLAEGGDVVVFEHKIERQSCTDCNVG